MREYRWDRRRAKKAARKPNFQFDIFDYVLLVLVFVIGLWAFHTFRWAAFQTGTCAEKIANYGSAFGSTPAFKQMFFLSLALLCFWAVLFTVRWKRFKSAIQYVLQAFLCLCILCMGFLSYHMSIWDNPNPPDGTLAVASGIWTTEEGGLSWRPVPLRTMEYFNINGDIVYEPERRTQKCVWLEAGMISADDDIIVNDYDGFLYNGQRKHEGLPSWRWYLPEWDPPNFSNYMHAIFTSKSHMQTIRDQELIRPLTDEERARFMEKRRCIKRAYAAGSPLAEKPHMRIVEHCDPEWFPAWP